MGKTLKLCRWIEDDLMTKPKYGEDKIVEFVGDAGLFAFNENKNAVDFAIELQREMRKPEHDFCIRIGIARCDEGLYSHTLQPSERRKGKAQTLYYGPGASAAEGLESSGVPEHVHLGASVYDDQVAAGGKKAYAVIRGQ